MKNWNNIGAVVVYEYGKSNPKWYASLKDAMIDLERGYSSYWEKRPLLDRINKRGWVGSDFWDCGDRYLIKDDLGLVVPHWKITEVYNNLSYDDINAWRHWAYPPKGYKFRCGPVPGRGYYWRGGSRAAKNLWQAVKADHIDKHDEELKEYRFKRRDYHDRFMEFIDWDCNKSDWRDRNWKRHRNHQWKGE